MARASNSTARDQRRGRNTPLRSAFLGAVCAASIAGLAGQAGAADRVRITGLSDVSFGTLSSLTIDSVQSQSICVYAKSPPANNYSVTASGSGTGGAFLLSSASGTLPFEVQWSDTPGQTSGSQLIANQPLGGQQNTASVDDCSSGPSSTASLIIILRSAALGAAFSGSYTGTLNLLIAPQ